MHAGEVELRGDDVSGLAVNIGARVCALAKPGEVLVTRTVKDVLAGSAFEFVDRGAHTLKGVPDNWQLFSPLPTMTGSGPCDREHSVSHLRLRGLIGDLERATSGRAMPIRILASSRLWKA